MPPPQAVICEVCGGKFFKHSYAHHLKQCIKKKEAQTVMCDWCGHAISKDEYASHTPACKAAHKGRKAKPRKGASAVSDRAKKKLAAMEEAKAAGKSAADIAMPPDKSMLGGVFDPFANLDAVLEAQGAFEEVDARVPCKHCSRKFNPDRIAKHELICGKVDKKKRRPVKADKWRLEGTDFAEHYDKDRAAADAERVKAAKAAASEKWRAEHAQLQEVAAVSAGGGGAAAPAAATPAIVIDGAPAEPLPSPTPPAAAPAPPSPAPADTGADTGVGAASPPAPAPAPPSTAPAAPVTGDGPSSPVAAAEGQGGTAPPAPPRTKLRVGDRVVTADGRQGVVQFKGPVWGLKKGNWYGVELDQALGKYDGSFREQKYFVCAPNHGIFMRASGLTSLAQEQAAELAAALQEEKDAAAKAYEQQKRVRERLAAKAAAGASSAPPAAAAGGGRRGPSGGGGEGGRKKAAPGSRPGSGAAKPGMASKLRTSTASSRPAGSGAAAVRGLAGTSRPGSGRRAAVPRRKPTPSTGPSPAEEARKARLAADADMLAALEGRAPAPTPAQAAAAAAKAKGRVTRPTSSGSTGGGGRRFAGGGGRLGAGGGPTKPRPGATRRPAAGAKAGQASGAKAGAKPAAGSTAKAGMSDREKRAAYFAARMG